MDRIKDTVKETLDALRQPRTTDSGKACACSDKAIPSPDIPGRYALWNMGHFSDAIQDALQPFFAGRVDTIYLHGGVGSRKTCLAAAILREWRALGKPTGGGLGYGEFVTASKLAMKARDMDNGKYAMHDWQMAPILVLDDLGAVRSTPHIVEQTSLLIEDRYDKKRPTIANGNLPLTELAEFLDARIASRLQEGLILNLGEQDWRKADAGQPKGD